MDAVGGTSLHAGAAVGAFAVVDRGVVILDMDRIAGAETFTFFAGDAAVFTDSQRRFGIKDAGAGNLHGLILRKGFDQAIGARFYTEPTASAKLTVDHGHPIGNRNCTVRANLCAVSEAQAPGCTSAAAAVKNVAGRTGRLAGINIFIRCSLTVAVAADRGFF